MRMVAWLLLVVAVIAGLLAVFLGLGAINEPWHEYDNDRANLIKIAAILLVLTLVIGRLAVVAERASRRRRP